MKYNWAVIGCGHIAGEMAEALKKEGESFFGVWGRNSEKTEAYALKYDVKNVYESCEALLSDENVDIVYIATPHNTHIDFLRAALSKKKHVLCEKAITLNSKELSEAVTLSEENGVILAEAMTIFHCPVYDEIERITASGRLGALRTIEVNLCTAKEYDMTSRFFSPDLAGGAMLDIGVYALSFIRRIMSQTPVDVHSVMTKAPTGVDEQVNIILRNSKDEVATAALSLVSKTPRLGVAGFEKGSVSFDNYNRSSEAVINYNDGRSEVIKIENDKSPLYHEVADMEKAVSGEKNNMCLNLTEDVMKIMTDIRYEHKMFYPEETGLSE